MATLSERLAAAKAKARKAAHQNAIADRRYVREHNAKVRDEADCLDGTEADWQDYAEWCDAQALREAVAERDAEALQSLESARECGPDEYPW